MTLRLVLIFLLTVVTGCVNQTVKSTSVPPLAQPPVSYTHLTLPTTERV